MSRTSDHLKALEILILRCQPGIAGRKLNRTIKPERIEKLMKFNLTLLESVVFLFICLTI